MRFVANLVLVTVALGFGAVTHVSAADPAVATVVLGLRSLEGDDELANGMTDGLRSAAKGVSHWRMLERAVSMSQMTLTHGCEDVDAACLGQISKGLEVERIVFGTVRRTASRSKFDYEVTVSIFNAGTHTIAGTETETVPRAEGKVKKDLVQHAQLLINRLAAADSHAGRLSIEVNVPNAQVSMDGQAVGQTQDGKLVLDNQPSGEHTLEISALDHQSRIQKVNISASEQSTIAIDLDPLPQTALEAPADAVATTAAAEESHGGSLAWLGYSLIGVGAASAIAWGASMYVIEFQYNRNASYTSARDLYRNRAVDACDAALGGDPARLNASQYAEFQSQCRTGRTFQVLQWVFLGAAVVTAGAGTYVLLSQSDSPDRAEARLKQPRLALTPLVERRSIALQATLRF
jgi:hypothetical protein